MANFGLGQIDSWQLAEEIFQYERKPQAMKTKAILIVILLMSTTFFSQTGWASEIKGSSTKQPAEAGRVIRQLVSVIATIEAINIDTRVVTLRAGKQVVTIVADEQIKRLNEFEVGDKVKAKYYVSLAGELREPTADEKETPLTIIGGTAKATSDAPPAGGKLRQIKAVMNIVNIDYKAERVTLQGPLGGHLIVQVIDPNRLEKVSLGDTVIITYTEALGLSLEKAE
jgi:hypothetical protein